LHLFIRLATYLVRILIRQSALLLPLTTALPGKRCPAFLIAQLAGALSASFVLHYLFPDNETLAITQPSGAATQSFILELLMTFILMLVILRVSTGAKEKGITAGIAIGGTVWMLVLFRWTRLRHQLKTQLARWLRPLYRAILMRSGYT
jgi:hypothetical protein